MIDLNKQKLDIECPNCSRKLQVTLEQVAKEVSVNCPSCRQGIKLVDKGKSTASGMKNLNKAFSDLDKSLKNLFK
jgi:predicted Zn finger-like uncharacterized protein